MTKRFESLSRYERVTKAHSAVAWAIRRGTLVRATECEKCGIATKTEGAHYDYREPLRVRWLCPPCHRRWDRDEPKNSGPGWNRPRKKPRQLTVFRIEAKMHRELKKAARAAGRTFSDYVRILLETHPDRKKPR